MNLWALQDFFQKNCIFFDTISFCCFAQVRHCIFVSFFLYIILPSIILPIIFYDKRNRPPGCSHVSMGLITAKSLSAPRCTKVVGIIDLICLTYPRLRRPVGIIDLICLTYPRLRRPEGIFDLILSHIPASVKVGGYIRPDFVSHTRFRKFCWVQIACF